MEPEDVNYRPKRRTKKKRKVYVKKPKRKGIKLTKKNGNDPRILIDLSTPAGNAFNIIKHAKKLSLQLHLNWNAIYEELTAGDYNNLIKVFEKHFGDFILIYH